jgi:hypothetical protein
MHMCVCIYIHTHTHMCTSMHALKNISKILIKSHTVNLMDQQVQLLFHVNCIQHWYVIVFFFSSKM